MTELLRPHDSGPGLAPVSSGAEQAPTQAFHFSPRVSVPASLADRYCRHVTNLRAYPAPMPLASAQSARNVPEPCRIRYRETRRRTNGLPLEGSGFINASRCAHTPTLLTHNASPAECPKRLT